MTNLIKVINFYKFIQIDQPDEIKMSLAQTLAPYPVLGSLIVATEGLNGSLSGSQSAIDQAFSQLKKIDLFQDLNCRESFANSDPFKRLVIKTKKQILAFPEEVDPKVEDIQCGPVLDPELWQEYLQQDSNDIIVLDTRNQYEVEVGTFKGAKHLQIESFRDFPKAFLNQYSDAKDKTILMFCTGGIRCEKAVAFAQNQGFQKVFKLDGGIINYFDQNGGQYWNGECFVFDGRETIRTDRQKGESNPFLVKKSEKSN